jgi:hypothetical protein
MAAVLPGVGLVERDLPVPFETVWDRIEDLEHSVPGFDRLVASLRVMARDGDRLRVVARAPVLRVPTTFDVELRRGWCWMQSKVYVVGMAATPTASGTRWAQLEGLPWWGTGFMRPLMRRLVADDIDGITRLLA